MTEVWVKQESKLLQSLSRIQEIAEFGRNRLRNDFRSGNDSSPVHHFVSEGQSSIDDPADWILEAIPPEERGK